MPNWCSTAITFYSESEKQINKLHDMITELGENESLLPNGFGSLWLGNILHHCGFDWEKIHCRGSIIDYDEEAYQDLDGRYYFEIRQEDAWGPKTEVWNEVLSKPEFCDVEYVYMAEECGCEIYINSDTSGLFYTDVCMVDAYLDTEDITPETQKYDSPNYFESVDDCLEYLSSASEAFGNKQIFASINEANNYFLELFENSNSCIVAHEYEAE